MVKQIDYKVIYKENKTRVTRTFSTFAAAAGTMNDLDVPSILNANIIYHDGGQYSGSMYARNGQGQRRKMNATFIRIVNHYDTELRGR